MVVPWQVPHDVPAEASRSLLECALSELLTGSADDTWLRHVRPLVRESWERSLEQRVNPDDAPRLEFEPAELEEYRRAHPLTPAMETIRTLLLPGSEEDTGIVIAVGDQAGRLLWVEGDKCVRSLVDDSGFVPGANWAEDAIGTSAPGTALALGRSVQIYGAEHFNRSVHAWSCTAAPVRDPETRRVLGVIDITGGPDAVTPQARLLVDATARAVESELMVARLRERGTARHCRPVPSCENGTIRGVLSVLGRDRARLETETESGERIIELSGRHAAIMLMLAVHPQGLSAEHLAALVYGEGTSSDTLRPEMVRLRKALERTAIGLIPESRPYRLPMHLETDAQDVLSLLERGAYRAALTAYRGPVLPASIAPGVEDFRDAVRATLREAMFSEASLDVLLSYIEIPEGRSDIEMLRLALEMLPPRSPKRSRLVGRIERLETS